ncbi:nucleotide exchange factor GrpE [Brevibacillus fulvus]|uniref:nucleotide exchange factor GrpE n=1 Tax=Brevibacillus fulvus TaxID=1125967 RepID=UPI0023BAD146|nr:nucleotide exchange factor GrpE [Brevibacillus fulvus]
MSDEKTPIEQEQESGNEAAKEATEAASAESAEQTSAVKPEETVEHWKALAEEHQSRMLRTLADMENLRKRVRREQEDLQKYASLKVIEELLPALDNFERALNVDKETVTVESLLQGVNMVYRQMVQVFEKEGLTPIETAGKPFDPNLHQAVMQVEDTNLPSGAIVEELQKGYQFKDRVIRPAMVKVNA